MIHQLHHLNLCFTKLLFFSFHSHKSAKKYSCQVPQVPVLPAPGEARRLQFSRMKPHVNQQKHYFWGIFVECWCWFNARPQEVHRESIGGSWTISKPQKYPCRIAYIKELNTSWLEMKPCNSLSCIFEASLIDIVAILSFGLARMSFFFLLILLVRPTRNSPRRLRSICGRNSESTWKLWTQTTESRSLVKGCNGICTVSLPFLSNTKIDIYDIYVLWSRLGFWKVQPFSHQWFWVFVKWHDWNLTAAAGSQLKPRPGCLLGLSPVPRCDCTKVGGCYWMFFLHPRCVCSVNVYI